ncbi:DNA alkylation repair protein [Actinokineospora sp. UTMC 2448]|uniref:DNA alkylation repair protein n=1 Tax=Actinokineospora sp. UTMC 2448 TaxID=2268449 RepID=UPI002164859D|nr:DNA alkylation repair protein [Actinokineospora sp. UTMC 2448]UVS80164.1 DNA alkylation repair enzyme [Actinokineospora sp. UTMC 2448]
MTFTDAARAALAAAADPVRAGEMRRYMKSAMPMHGVPKPTRAALVRNLVAEHPFTDRPEWIAATCDLWRSAQFREERYLALDLIGHPRYAHWQAPDLLPVYEEFITTGAWWDFVDEIATHRLNDLLHRYRTEITPPMRAWATSPNKWKRRASVLCQLGHKADTDVDLLAHAIEANATDPDFFLRKAIGWALRQYSRTDPEWVRAFVDSHPALSPLSRREAVKHL